MTKKIYAAVLSAIAYLSYAIPAYAQTVNPCPKNAGGGFANLCDWNKNTVALMIKNGITILLIIATVAALFFLIFGGIRWITSGGDKTKLEESRNIIIAAIIGLVLTLLSYFILNVVLGLFGLPTIGDFDIPVLVL